MVMTRFWLGIVLALTFGEVAQAGTTPHYINTTAVNTTQPPQIDATTFENRSLFDFVLGGGFSFFGNFGGSSRSLSFGTPRPYETFNTLNFTNTAAGVIYADPGYIWDHSYAGGRGRMANWVNKGAVQASGWAWVEATNIVSSGLGFSVGPHGIVHLEGGSVNLSRSLIYLGPSSPAANGSGTGILVDQWWQTSSNAYTLDGSLSGLTVPNTQSPSFRYLTGGGIFSGGATSLPETFSSAGNYDAFVYTNAVSATETMISVIFAPTNAIQRGVATDVGWFRNGRIGLTAQVRFSAPDVDLFTGVAFTNFVTIRDSSPWIDGTNIFLISDGGGSIGGILGLIPLGFIPITMDLQTGLGLFGSFTGSPTNAIFDPDLLVNPTYLSNRVAAGYSAFSTRLTLTDNPYEGNTFRDASPAGWSGLPVRDLSNYVGRVEIKAKKLNLDLVRMRAETSVAIQTDDLVGNKAPIIDAPYLSFDLRSTQSQLVVSNMIAPSVNRFIGDVSVWSSLWLNFTTNNLGVTNFYYTHVMVLDHTLSLTQQVTLADLKLRATNVVIADTFNVGRSFLVEAKNFVNSGNLTNLSGGDLGGMNFIGILNFTNTGVISTARNLNLGSDRTTPYNNVVNYGTINTAAMQIKTRQLINTNVLLTTSGSFESQADSTRLENSSVINSFSELILGGGDLYASNSVLSAGTLLGGAGTLIFDFDGTVSDAGLVSSNLWVANNGFAISSVPKGDLLGTTIQSIAPVYQEVVHFSEAADLGVNPVGYTNNFAIGRLLLDGGSNSLFRFAPSPGSTGRALYVDYLDLANYATNYQDAITVDEGCVLYFANASIDPTKLNHLSDDRLRWVSTYAGPRSITNLVVGPITNALNIALVSSADIDSDNDGVANVNDSTPVWTAQDINLTIALTNLAAHVQVPVLTWNVLRSFDSGGFQNYVTNSVEYVTSAGQTDWLTLTNFVSALGGAQSTLGHYIDRLGTNRMYRVRVHVQDP